MHKKIISMTLTVVAAAGALLVAACGSTSVAPAATPTPTTAPSPTPTPVLDSTFTSSDGVYTFQYPGSWSSTPLNTAPVVNGDLLISPDTQDYFITVPLNLGIPASQYPSFLQGFLPAFGGKNIKITPKGNVTIGANTWTEDDVTFTKNGTPYDGAQFGLSHHGKTFLVLVLAPASTADSVGTTYFQPMLTSLKFLK